MNHDFSHFYWVYKAINPPDDVKKVKGASNLYTAAIIAKLFKWVFLFLLFIGIYNNFGWNFLWVIGAIAVGFIIFLIKATWPKPNKKPNYHLGSGY